ncbi:hypothetical protein MASR2M36_34470 [Providencia sp.]
MKNTTYGYAIVRLITEGKFRADDESRVHTLFSLNRLFTHKLASKSLFTEKVAAFYFLLRDHGAKKTI